MLMFTFSTIRKCLLGLGAAGLAALAIRCTNPLDRLTRERDQHDANRKELTASYSQEIDLIGAKYGIKSDGIGFMVAEAEGRLQVKMTPAEAAKVTNPQDRARIEYLLGQIAQERQLDLAKIKREHDQMADNSAIDLASGVFTVVEQGAEPQGGFDGLMKHLQTNLQYPEAARQNGIEGKVYVEFIIEKDGVPSSLRVLKGVGHGCDQEALRVVQAMPKWTPGQHQGQLVRQRIVLPLAFRLGGPETASQVGQSSPAAKAQTDQNEVFTVVEKSARPVGGIESVLKHLQANLKYPQAARNAKVQGKVFVEFIVQPDGTLSNFMVRKGIGQGCDEEALRVMASLPKWEPGQHQGQVVKQRMVLPVAFQLGQ
jgi:periplasmic protein TonB